MKANFLAYLQDEGGLFVPGSLREGHNVFTDTGRHWLSQIIAWASLGIVLPAGDNDVSFTGDRLRWIGVGAGGQLEQVGVSGLVDPLELSAAPLFIKQLGGYTKPVPTSFRYTTTFSGSDFTHLGASVVVSEAGIFVDRDDGTGPNLDPSVATNSPVAYRAFEPLTKLAAQTLTIRWEFRF